MTKRKLEGKYNLQQDKLLKKNLTKECTTQEQQGKNTQYIYINQSSKSRIGWLLARPAIRAVAPGCNDVVNIINAIVEQTAQEAAS